MSMQNVFKSDEMPYISPIVNLKAFLEEALATKSAFAGNFNLESLLGYGQETFVNYMTAHGHSTDDAGKIINIVNHDLQRIVQANPMQNFELTFPPKDSKLHTHAFLHSLRGEKTTALKNQLVMRGKYYKYREQELQHSFATMEVDGEPPAAKDLICTVHLLAPMNKTPETHESVSLRNRCEVKFLVRGDMPLLKLRDKIFCASDWWCVEEATPFGNEKARDKNSYLMNKYTSSFIFIHDTFYIDTRSTSIDISEPVRAFMDRKNEIGQYQVNDISEAKIIDITLRLGEPYVYQHQGSCEHLMIFSDLRVACSNDEQKLEEYPIRVYDNIRQVMCCTCREAVAMFVITESDRMPMSPAHMCASCFQSFHFDGQNRVGNFKAYHYTDLAGME